MFSIPSRLTLEIQPIGRGTVQLLNGEKGSGQGSEWGEYFIFALSVGGVRGDAAGIFSRFGRIDT